MKFLQDMFALENKKCMEILITMEKNSQESHSLAEKISKLLNHCEFETNSYKSCEVIDVYAKKINKVRKYKNYHKDGFLPFLFIHNKN